MDEKTNLWSLPSHSHRDNEFRSPYSASNSVGIINVLCFTLIFVSLGKPSLSCQRERETEIHKLERERKKRKKESYIYEHTENIAENLNAF